MATSWKVAGQMDGEMSDKTIGTAAEARRGDSRRRRCRPLDKKRAGSGLRRRRWTCCTRRQFAGGNETELSAARESKAIRAGSLCSKRGRCWPRTVATREAVAGAEIGHRAKRGYRVKSFADEDEVGKKQEGWGFGVEWSNEADRAQASTPTGGCASPFKARRFKRYQAFDAGLDRDALAEARSWFESFDSEQLPKGNTTYARSSGPGGQHVNKTETKAITAYPVGELLSKLPKSLHASIRKSRYYTASNDSLTFQAQTSRSRSTNAEDNRKKLVEEVTRIYEDVTPAETSEEKKKKHEEIGKKFHDSRIRQKKFSSAKKQARRGPSG
ncbi:hypothetical protein FDECE_15551 [Fusarium decemcellulare]|nr:hypothetical protein FDECE_15551 [Fusarium decemcellulare]